MSHVNKSCQVMAFVFISADDTAQVQVEKDEDEGVENDETPTKKGTKGKRGQKGTKGRNKKRAAKS